VAELKLALPPLGAQRAIADFLDEIEGKIELNRRMNETLEAMARALFKSWFVDFDPVRAKAEGRDAGLPQPLADLFPDSFEDSELGEIPKGWEIKTVDELADVVGGTTPSTKEPSYWEAGVYAWATPKDLAALSVPVLLDTDRRITDAGLSQIGSGLLPEGTVLLSSRAPIGYLAIAEVPVAINQGFIAMRPKAGSQFAARTTST
jgi:type I restriction enzyme S subunit